MRPLRCITIILVASTLVVGCKKDNGKASRGLQTGDESAPVPVETVVLETGPIEDTLRFSSTLRAEKQVSVLARTAGQVRVRAAEEGDVVKANEVLARIEADEQTSAVSSLENDLAMARRSYERNKALHARGVVSVQALESSKFELDRLVIARRDAGRSLRYTVVRAPIAGTISQRLVKYGDLVMPNQPLFEIIDFDSIIAEVFVPEKDVHRVASGAIARLSSPSSGEQVTSAQVARIAPVVDARSGTIKITMTLPPTDDRAASLRPGMLVDVHLVVASETAALLLPRRALVYDNDVPYAFRMVGDDRVERVRVDIEIEDREYIKPRRGFAAGDRVIVAGQVGLKDKGLVKPSAAPDTPAAADVPEKAPPAAPTDSDETTPTATAP